MLCNLCETSLTDLVHRDVATWKRLSGERWYAFRHGNYHTVKASAAAGCQLCSLFNDIRRQRVRDLDGLAEKWHSQNAMIDVQQSPSDGPCIFQLLTEAPEKSWIPFELFLPAFIDQAEGDVVSTDFAIPVQVPPDAASGRTIGTARRWIDDCRCNHPPCARRDSIVLPTRVIDVGPLDGPATVRLYDNSARDRYGQYVALSHCWGVGERLTTTKRNIGDFQRAIPVEQLPKTFQDAIALTRMLGMRYLWLDALCIVQDDREDWRRESAAMCAVYENASFSISAVSATDSGSGLFNHRSDESCVATVDGTVIGVRPQLDPLDVALQHSKIESRAWCMQERILAPAILHVGPQQWYWECRAGEFSESYPRGSPSSHHGSLGGETAKCSHIPPNISRARLLDIWYDLVGQYSARDLTKPSDRLPAISGLAERLTRELGDPSLYCHGLWADDVVTGLLWQRPIHRFRRLIPSRDRYSARYTHAQKPGRFKFKVAPSWSWAAVRGAVDYSWRNIYTIPDFSRQADLSLIQLERGDSFIQASGYVRRGTCRLRESGFVDKSGGATGATSPGNATFKASGSLIVDEGLPCILDDPDDTIPKSCYCLRVSSWSRDHMPTPNRQKERGAKTFYLIIERLQGPVTDQPPSLTKNMNFLGRFRRIGMGYDDRHRVENVLVNAARHSVEIA